ncbi:MAG: hypothetical protein MJE77_47555 [Proteobacteria bacterium]|nr:hypothetical protein [Pseudomonadota bacterium]
MNARVFAIVSQVVLLVSAAGAGAQTPPAEPGAPQAPVYQRLDIPDPLPSADAQAFVELANDIRDLCQPTGQKQLRQVPAAAQNNTGGDETCTAEAITWANAQSCAKTTSQQIRQYWEVCAQITRPGVPSSEILMVFQRYAALDSAQRQMWIALMKGVEAADDGDDWAAIIPRGPPSATSEESPPQAFVGGFGSFQDRLISGLAEWLVSRAKLEVESWMRRQLKKSCGKKIDDEKPSLGTVEDYVPALCSVLGSETLSLHALGKTLRAAAQEDLRRLPDYVLWRWQVTDADRAGTMVALRVVYAIGMGIRQGRDPVDLLAGLARLPDEICRQSPSCSTVLGKIRDLGRTTAVLLPVIRAAAADEASRQSIQKNVVYYAVSGMVFLYEQLPQQVTETWNQISSIFAVTLQMVDMLKAIRTTIDNPLNDANDLLSGRGGISFGRGGFVPVRNALGTGGLIPVQNATSGDESSQAMANLQLSRWTQVLAMAQGLVMASLGDAADGTLARAVSRTVELVLAGDYAAMLREAEQLVSSIARNQNGSNNGLDSKVIRLLSLGVELAEATSSDEVSRILEAAAAPPGGYADKYKRSVASITGFVGIGGFVDRASAGNAQVDDLMDSRLALYPVGMVGLQRTWAIKEWVHVGGYISLVDVGALVRLAESGNETTATVDGTEVLVSEGDSNEIGISQVFSPGLFATVGLFGSPFTLGLGGSITPELHAIELDPTADGEATQIIKARAVRFGVFVSADVTVWSF